MRLDWLVVIAVVALLTPMDAIAESCQGNCLDDDRSDLYYCQNPNQGLKRQYEQQRHCESSTFWQDGCTGTSQADPDELDYTDYDGYAVTVGSAGWYAVVGGQVTFCGASQCANGEHPVYYSGTGCVAVTWGFGTPHNGLIHCLWP